MQFVQMTLIGYERARQSESQLIDHEWRNLKGFERRRCSRNDTAATVIPTFPFSAVELPNP